MLWTYVHAPAPFDVLRNRRPQVLVSAPLFEAWIEGQPLPKGRPRMVRKGGRTHVYTPTKTKAWEDAVAWQIRAALRAGEPIAGDVAVELAFYREKNHRADLDNLVKAVSDAMNGLVYRDDAQIVRYQSSVQYGVEHPGVRVVVRAA